MIRSFLTAGLIAILGALSTSCGDDDPASSNQPCDDANMACLDLRVSDVGMTYTTFYTPDPLEQTIHNLDWNMDSKIISNYAPGSRVYVNVTFDPPIKVIYQHASSTFEFGAGVSSICQNRNAHPTPSISTRGWEHDSQDVICAGDCSTGESLFNVYVVFSLPEVGSELEKISFQFTVPATYTSGDAQGTSVLPGDLPVFAFRFSAFTIGNTTSNGPPIWPGQPPTQ